MSKATELYKKLQFVEADAPPPAPHPTAAAPSKPQVPQKPQEVPGGVLFRRDMTPKEYNDQTARMRHLSKINNKRWNSVFSIHQPIGRNDVFHLFHLYFNKDDFAAGATNPERAERIKYVGQFDSKQAALDFLKSSADPSSDFSKQKDVEAGGGKQHWTGKDLGAGSVKQDKGTA
jgi:hypothetical protein